MSPAERQIQRSAVVAGRLLEAFVFAPIGAGAKLVTDGPAAVARARQELSNARFIGEMVVGQGGAQLRERLSTAPAAAPAEPATPNADSDSMSENALEVQHAADGLGVAEVDVDVLAGELAIPDYDLLPAIDIVGMLESLSVDELGDVESYERTNRRRRTVLGKISQLSGDA